MAVHPISEKEAPQEVKDCFNTVKSALDLPNIPLFFMYLGAFPEYLKYLTNQIGGLAKNHEFNSICNEIGEDIITKISHSINHSKEYWDWISRYQYSPTFYNFQKGLSYIFLNNIKLAFIFIALREAVKGWAIAAKKLPSTGYTRSDVINESRAEEFVFSDLDNSNLPDIEYLKAPSSNFETSKVNDKRIVKRETSTIEKDLLPEYFALCRSDFTDILKTEEFLHFRVNVEQRLLNTLDILPSAIHSPVNIVIQYTSKYQDFPDLLYLLSEHFPTYAVQRMLFSAFMINLRS